MRAANYHNKTIGMFYETAGKGRYATDVLEMRRWKVPVLPEANMQLALSTVILGVCGSAPCMWSSLLCLGIESMQLCMRAP